MTGNVLGLDLSMTSTGLVATDGTNQLITERIPPT